MSAPPPRKPLKKRIVTAVIWIAVLGFVFGYFLPQFIDYDQVWQAIKGLSWWEFLVLAAVGLLRIPTEAIMYRALLPELTLRDAMRTWLISSAGMQFLPAPADSIAFYAVARSSGVESRRAITGSLMGFVYPTIGKFLLPLVAIVPFAIFAVVDDEALLFFLITLGVAILVALIVYLLVRSEASAYHLGDWASRGISWPLVRLAHRDALPSFGPSLQRFRADSIETVRSNWRTAALGVTANLLIIYVILLLSLRFVGLSNEQLPWVEVLAAYALAQWASTCIPISPGGLGIADAVLISSLSSVAPGNSDLVTAGVVLWRVFSWALPIPIGLISLRRWQRSHPDALQDAKRILTKRGRGPGAEPAETLAQKASAHGASRRGRLVLSFRATLP